MAATQTKRGEIIALGSRCHWIKSSDVCDNSYLPLVFAACLSIYTVLGSATESAEPSARVEIGGAFELVASDGKTVTNETYLGEWLLVTFGYTYCPDVCPMTMMLAADVLDDLGDDAGLIQPMFITVDPARDTPDVMRAFVAALDPRIIGLTGSPEAIEAVANAYRVHFKANRDADADEYYTMEHSTYLYLMDPEGAFVRGFGHGESGESIAAIIKDAIARR